MTNDDEVCISSLSSILLAVPLISIGTKEVLPLYEANSLFSYLCIHTFKLSSLENEVLLKKPLEIIKISKIPLRHPKRFGPILLC